MFRWLLHPLPPLRSLPSECNCDALVQELDPLPPETKKLERKPRSSAFALFQLRGLVQLAPKNPFNRVEIIFRFPPYAPRFFRSSLACCSAFLAPPFASA